VAQLTPEEVSNLPIPKQLQDAIKKWLNEHYKKNFKPKKSGKKKEALVGHQEVIILGISIPLIAYVMAFSKTVDLLRPFNSSLLTGPLLVPRLNFIPADFSSFLFQFESAIIAIGAIQSIIFLADILYSFKSKTQKELRFWNFGTITLFISGMLVKLPFANPSIALTYGDMKYKTNQQKKVSALNALVKAFTLSVLVIPFALMYFYSTNNLLLSIGSYGLLQIPILLFCYAFPLSPLPGKEIYNYSKWLAIVLSIPVLLFLYLQYMGWILCNGYLLIGLASALIMLASVLLSLREKEKLGQAYLDLWFNRSIKEKPI
jgi:hypothetical protein